MTLNQITVLSPDGKVGSIPAEQWLDAKNQGYSLPQLPAKLTDLSEDQKSVNVINPEGKSGSIPIEQFEAAKSQGYKLVSEINPLNKSLFDENLKTLLPDPTTHDYINKGTSESREKELEGRLTKEPIQDEKGNFLLKTPNGEIIPVHPDHLIETLSDGQLKFNNDSYQALLDARLKAAELGNVKEQWNVMGNNMLDTPLFGLGSYLRKRSISDKDVSAYAKSEDIADQIASQTSLKKEANIGTGIGLAGAILNPTGILGEGAAATSLGGKVVSSLAPTGSTLVRQVAARAAAGAVEGAVLSAPQALVQTAIMKDPKAAAESLALGVGIGGILGSGSKLIGAGFEKLVGSGALRENRVTSALSSLGATEEILPTIGNKPQQEKFLNTLMENGVTSSATAPKIEEALRNVSTGGHLTSTLESLDKVADSIPVDSLLSKIGKSVENGQISLFQSPKVAEVSNDLAKKLTDTASSKGELTLSSLRRFTSDVGNDINWSLKKIEDVATAKPAEIIAEEINNVKKGIFTDAKTALINAGDAAAEKANAKIATSWAEGKVIAEASDQMRVELLKDIASGKLNEKLSPILSKIKDMITTSVSHGPTGAGYAIGGPLGGFLGSTASNSIKNKLNDVTDHLVEGYLNNPENSSKLTSWLSKNKASEAISSYVAMDAIHSTGEKIAGIAPFISNLAAKTPSMYLSNEDPIKSILGINVAGLSKQQQYDKLSDQVAKLAGNPELLNSQASNLTASLGSNHPELTLQMQQDFTNKVQYLQQILHGKNNAEAATPFKKNEKYKPTTADLKEMTDQLAIAQNPFALLDGLKNGKVTAKQVATASVLNPAILEQIRSEITKEAYSGKSNLTYQQRLSASVIMGQAMDQSLKQLPQLQSVYNTQQAQPTGKQGKAPKMNVSKMPSAQGTTAQRISNK